MVAQHRSIRFLLSSMVRRVGGVVFLVVGGLIGVVGITLATTSSANALVANAPIVGIAVTADGGGYWMLGRDGGLFTFGDAPFDGSAEGAASAPIVGMAVDPQTGGYRMATSDGGLWWRNSSSFGWVTGPLSAPVVGIATDDATDGYWMVAADGGVFAFNAPFLGSMGGTRLSEPIVGMAGTPDGNGYWLVAKDGGVFAFGDAAFYGSMGGTRLNQPVVGMAADSQTGGYWLVARDGGIFAFNAPFYGSMGGSALNAPIVGMAGTPDGQGYCLAATDGGVFSFGDCPFLGSVPGIPSPVGPVRAPVIPSPGGSSCMASMSNATPGDYVDDTVIVSSNVADAPVSVTKYYRTTTTQDFGNTNANGVASIGLYTSGATIGFRVVVDVSVNNGQATCSTSFIPR
jgi:hypothetical protein